MRIRVSMEVSKPLKRVLKLHTTLGDEQLLSFTYERLPNFCYLCGCLGHLSKFCELRFAEDFTDPGEATPFGPWMRATNLPTGRNRPLALSRNMSIPQFSPDQKSLLVLSPVHPWPHPKGGFNIWSLLIPHNLTSTVTESRIALSDISNIGGGHGVAPAGAMILLCRNCQGLGTPCTVHALGELLRAHNPSLVFFGRNQVVSDRITLMSWFIRIPMPRPGEKAGRRPRLIWQMGRFREAFSVADLYDLGYEGDQFTWCNRHPEPDTIYERLDRVCAIPFGGPDFPQQWFVTSRLFLSDHAVIMVDSENTPRPPLIKHKPFWFEAAWASSPDCEQIVRESWTLWIGHPSSSLLA
ncbi:UNVERIFIED_CONTAM: hypothetical protein Scaly_0692800 [Sesamum calycinum]|uniref:Zinc knuckle CX2CX4HX4C domain-containing protein n=1 Tax=Sesamum calycinum TaxID=2727403 RepID=A0AAW2R6K6_9LAMI